jgi:hypothetical protein
MALYGDLKSPVLDQHQAFSDAPVPLLYRKLDVQFPGSKFVLTRRPLEPWLTSMEWLFKHGKVKWCWNRLDHQYHQEFFGTCRYDKARLTAKYHAYHAEVQEYFRGRDRDLLVIDLDGKFDVAGLCAFLGRPPVSIDFPRANARESMPYTRRLRYAVYEKVLASETMDRLFGRAIRRLFRLSD